LAFASWSLRFAGMDEEHPAGTYSFEKDVQCPYAANTPSGIWLIAGATLVWVGRAASALPRFGHGPLSSANAALLTLRRSILSNSESSVHNEERPTRTPKWVMEAAQTRTAIGQKTRINVRVPASLPQPQGASSVQHTSW
jgi:hypothetical protein